MLPANERLRRASAFQRAYSARKSISTPLVTLYVVPRARERDKRAPLKPRMPFVGFVAAKKVCKSAVARNRAKRRLREAYRLLTRRQRQLVRGEAGVAQDAGNETCRLDQWYVLVWVLHTKILSASWNEIVDTVKDCLKKAESKFGVGPKKAMIKTVAPGEGKSGD